MARKRKPKNTMLLTDLGVSRLKKPAAGQVMYWDTAQKGLALLVSPGGTKSFRSMYKLHGEWKTRTIGRYGEMVANADPDEDNVEIGEARRIVKNDRALAKKGQDPEKPQQEKSSSTDSFEKVVDRFIDEYAKARQRTWDQTERILKRNCAVWLKRQFKTITDDDAKELLVGFKNNGHHAKALITRAWLKKLWRWAYAEKKAAGPIMDRINITLRKKRRKDRYSDDELKSIWLAADKLSADECAYIKLIMLLAPRKTSFGLLNKSDVAKRKVRYTNDTGKEVEKEYDVIVTPPDRVKQSLSSEDAEDREYVTPLPPLALALIRDLLKQDGNRIFPSIPVSYSKKAARPSVQGRRLMKRLAKNGGPEYFSAKADYHKFRRTIASWLQDEGHSLEDRSLVLEHKLTGVTADHYSRGTDLLRKGQLLNKWANHIERLVTPKGENVVQLRRRRRR